MSIRLKISALLIILFITAISNSMFIFYLESEGEKQLNWINHTHNILNISEKYISAIKDAETGQRGYLITENNAYLDPYYNGVNDAKEYFTALVKLTSDNDEQQVALKNIEKLMLLKFDELERTIHLTQRDNKNKAIEIVVNNQGKEYMDNIRAKLSTFTNIELFLLERRKATFSIKRARISTLIVVEIVFFISLAISTLLFLQRNLFSPLKLLLLSAKKIESGEKLEINDIVDKNEMGKLLSTFFDMSQKVYQREQALGRLAHHDKLTGLKNRLTVSEDIEKSISELREKGGKLAVLFLDLNLFKEVNDTLGHEIGDLILKETADRLNSSVRSSDTVFRIGGDEFLVIVRNIKNIPEVHGIVKNILSTFSKPAYIQGKYMDISISIGVSVSPDDSTIGSELVKFSDVAMYSAKRDKDSSYTLFNKSMLKRESDIVEVAKR